MNVTPVRSVAWSAPDRNARRAAAWAEVARRRAEAARARAEARAVERPTPVARDPWSGR